MTLLRVAQDRHAGDPWCGCGEPANDCFWRIVGIPYLRRSYEAIWASGVAESGTPQ